MPTKRIFPGYYPSIENKDGTVSNILTSVVQFEEGGRYYIIPTMRDGIKMTDEQARKRAEITGIKNYPSYEDLDMAIKESKAYSGNIDEYGFLKIK